MIFIKIDPVKYFDVNVVSFNNWNRIFERCMHILRTDLNMPNYEELVLTLHSILRIVFPPDDINCNPQLTKSYELELASKFLCASLSFLIDIGE
jgi:hypothetical protein